MAKAKKAEKQDKENESVDSILGKIKNMVSGKEKVVVEDDETMQPQPANQQDITEDEPLELMEEVLEKKEEDGEESEFVDLLKEIDQALESQYLAEQTQAKEEVLATPIIEAEVDIQPAEKLVELEPEEDIAPQTPDLIAPQTQPAEILQASTEEVKKELSEIKSDNIVVNAEPKHMTENKQNILSQEIAEKSSKAIQDLLNNIPRPDIDSPAFRSAVTIEDIVLETLKPMLKQWLDNNLEVLVRDIVEREIRKIIPRE